MKRIDVTRILAVILAGVVSSPGCGGTAPGPATAACDGLVLRGACWVAEDGITLSVERIGRVVARAEAYWDYPSASLNGWRIEFRRDRVLVEGALFDGYCWPRERLVVATPFARDCFERSAIFHELGHVWGFGEGDPRMTDTWPLVQEAMEASRWEGCDPDEERDQRASTSR
jgi:hypothetical protein